MDWADLAIPHAQNLAWSATLVVAWAAAELRGSRAYQSGAKARLTNFLIGTIVALFGVLLAILFELLKGFMPEEGLIGYVIPAWRPAGVVGVLVSILAYGVVWDFFQYWFH